MYLHQLIQMFDPRWNHKIKLIFSKDEGCSFSADKCFNFSKVWHLRSLLMYGLINKVQKSIVVGPEEDSKFFTDWLFVFLRLRKILNNGS